MKTGKPKKKKKKKKKIVTSDIDFDDDGGLMDGLRTQMAAEIETRKE